VQGGGGNGDGGVSGKQLVGKQLRQHTVATDRALSSLSFSQFCKATSRSALSNIDRLHEISNIV
jgi:hypothetical protein